MLSLTEYLVKAGYSLRRIPLYEKRLRDFSNAFQTHVKHTEDDIKNFCGNNARLAEDMQVIERYLRLSLKLIDKTRMYQSKSRLGFKKAAAMFLEELKRRNYSKSTLHYYRYSYDLLREYLASISVQRINRIDKRALNSFKQYLFMKRTAQGKLLDMGTQSAVLHMIKYLFDFLTREEYLKTNPARLLQFPKKEKKISRNLFTQKEIAHFLEVVDTGTLAGFYDRAMFELLYSTGLRVNELINLKCRHLKLEDNLLTVFEGKGRNDRVCVLTPIAVKYVEAFITKVRPRYLRKGKKAEYLFTRSTAGQLDSSDVEDKIKRYAALAGINHPVSCHAFRRSVATHLLEEGVNLRYIQALLGHKNINTTLDYLKISVRDLREVLINHHPREKRLASSEIVFKGKKRHHYEDQRIKALVPVPA